MSKLTCRHACKCPRALVLQFMFALRTGSARTLWSGPHRCDHDSLQPGIHEDLPTRFGLIRTDAIMIVGSPDNRTHGA